MRYKDIVIAINTMKRSHQNETTEYTVFDHFSVCKTASGNCFIVDNDIAKKISSRSWCLSHGYPVTRVSSGMIRLHDYVMATTIDEKPVGSYVDHINQDKTDNRRCNLRIVTPTESALNMPTRSDNTSGVKGVSRIKNGTYRAYITVNKKQKSLGHYKTLKEAADARRKAEIFFGFIPSMCMEQNHEDE